MIGGNCLHFTHATQHSHTLLQVITFCDAEIVSIINDLKTSPADTVQMQSFLTTIPHTHEAKHCRDDNGRHLPLSPLVIAFKRRSSQLPHTGALYQGENVFTHSNMETLGLAMPGTCSQNISSSQCLLFSHCPKFPTLNVRPQLELTSHAQPRDATYRDPKLKQNKKINLGETSHKCLTCPTGPTRG